MGETTLAKFFDLEGQSRPCQIFTTSELEKQMSKFTSLIVGAHFRPPAKQLLAALAQGHQLRLEEQNDNPYDAAAVRVMLDLTDHEGLPLFSEFQLAQLEIELPNAGMSLEQLMSAGPVQLGFVPAQDGKPLAKARQTEPELLGNLQVRELIARDQDGDIAVSYSLAFAMDGSPRLLIEVGEQELVRSAEQDLVDLNERVSGRTEQD